MSGKFEMPPIPRRRDVIAAQKVRGNLIAAIFPVHHPRALWRAFNVTPIEVWGPPGTDTTSGDAHLQAYTCAIVRGGLSFVLDGRADDASLFVVPHACDSTQGLGSLLLDFIRPNKPVLTYYLPRGEGEPAVDFLAGEMRALFEKLAAITGRRPSDEALTEAIHREEAADAALVRLHTSRAQLPLTCTEFYRIVRAREFVPAEDFLPIAEAVLSAADEEHKPRGEPVILSGMIPEPMEIFEVLRRAGLFAAGDDFTCTGRRLYPPSFEKNPFRRLASTMLGGPPDATRGCSVQARADHLLSLVKRTSSRAVIFHEVKFCEPEAYYLPQVRKALESAGVRSIVLESNPLEPLSDQAVTRLEALAEIFA